MPTIYFNHFRGFERTFLDLKEVNFFVGENSTGKTSVLKLIGIMASPAFWRYGEFGNNEIGFGTFDDVITSSRTSIAHFEIGIQDSNPNIAGGAFLMKLRYVESDKLPLLKEICYCTQSINLQTIIEGKTVKYRYRKVDDQTDGAVPHFPVWLDNNGLNDIEFSRMGLQYISIVSILTQLSNQIVHENSIKELNSLHGRFDIILPAFAEKLAWLAPIRAEPLALYQHTGLIPNADGRHSPSLLKEILGPQVRHILNKFGADSGLFEDIQIKDLFDLNALDTMKNFQKSGNPKDKAVTSDVFELRVTINGESRNIVNVGYGVSQVLPIVIEAIARQVNTWFATQQPELHLHPRAQAALGDFVFKTNSDDHQKFIIETHSDYIIDRFRLRLNRALREKKTRSAIAQVVFFSKTSEGNKLEPLLLNDDGSYPDEQPQAFRDFFIKEQLDVISI